MRDDGASAASARGLMEWAAATARAGAQSLPEQVVKRTAGIIGDDLAAMIVAAAEPEVQAVNAWASNRGPAGGATILGVPDQRVTSEWAAAANAIAGNWLELDGGYRSATCHGSLYTLPSALAETEAAGRTIDELISAVVVAYEVVTRVARAYRPPLPLAAHPHATLSPIGAAAAVAAARQLDDDAFWSTVMGGATLSLNGPFSHATQGATVRNAWAGAGARLGFFAADMAEAGISASGTALHDVFATSYDYPEDLGPLTEGLGERFAVEDGYHKLYACCQYLHSSVEAAAELAQSAMANADTADITEITVRTHPLAAALRDADPQSVLGGKFSLPHAVSTVLATGSIDQRVFSSAHLHDPRVQALRPRVRIEQWSPVPQPPQDRPSTVTVRMRDGSVHESTVLSAIGGPDRPLSAEQLLEKITDMTEQTHPRYAAVARELMDDERDLGLPVAEFVAALLSKG